MVLPGSDEPIPALLLDVSRSGLFVKGSSGVQLGARVVVRFRLRPVGWCEAEGTIVRRTEVVRLHGFGVQFERVNESFAAFVDTLATLPDNERAAYVADVLGPVIEVSAI